MTFEADHKGSMEQQLKLFGMDLTQLHTNFSHVQPVQAGLGGQIRANKKGHNTVPELENNPGRNFVLSNTEGSATSKNSSSAQGSEGRIFTCRYCSRKFHSSRALGGHQKAHKEDRTARKSNPSLNSLRTGCLQYPLIGQNPSQVMSMSTSNGIFSHNFELQRVSIFSQKVELASSSVKRARNDIELGSGALPSVKRPRNEDLQNAGILSHNIELLSIPLSSLKRTRNDIELGSADIQQHNTVPGRMVKISEKDEELDLSLHL